MVSPPPFRPKAHSPTGAASTCRLRTQEATSLPEPLNALRPRLAEVEPQVGTVLRICSRSISKHAVYCNDNEILVRRLSVLMLAAFMHVEGGEPGLLPAPCVRQKGIFSKLWHLPQKASDRGEALIKAKQSHKRFGLINGKREPLCGVTKPISHTVTETPEVDRNR